MRPTLHLFIALSGMASCLASSALAASECQPLFDAYAAQMRLPAIQKTVTTPGMADAVEMILTQDTLFSRVGSSGDWTRVPLTAATRAMLIKGMPTEANVTDCRRIGPDKVGDVPATAFEFAAPPLPGREPGERLTALIGDADGLPLLETAAKAGTSTTMVNHDVTAPTP